MSPVVKHGSVLTPFCRLGYSIPSLSPPAGRGALRWLWLDPTCSPALLGQGTAPGGVRGSRTICYELFLPPVLPSDSMPCSQAALKCLHFAVRIHRTGRPHKRSLPPPRLRSPSNGEAPSFLCPAV